MMGSFTLSTTVYKELRRVYLLSVGKACAAQNWRERASQDEIKLADQLPSIL